MSLEISAETSFALDLTNAVQYGPELHIDANAASDPNGNEADATTGWTPASLSGTGSNVFESQSSVKSVGSYALYADCNDTPTSIARFDKTFTVENGATYNIRYNRRHVGTGGNWQFQANSINQDLIETAETTFTSISVNVTATSTSMACRFVEFSGTNDGGIYMDNFSIRKVL